MSATNVSPFQEDRPLSYNFLSARFGEADYDSGLDSNLWSVGGTFEINDSMFVFGGFTYEDQGTLYFPGLGDVAFEAEVLSIGLGGHVPISDRVDAVGTVALLDASRTASLGTAKESVSESGYELALAVRGRLAPRFEGFAEISRVDLETADTVFRFGGALDLTEQLGLTFGYAETDGADALTIGIRIYL